MRLCTAFRAVSFVILAGSVTVALPGCKQREAKPGSPAAARTSSVVVHNAADGIHTESQKANFLLSATGNLTASSKGTGASRGLDEFGTAPGITITTGKRMVSDFQRDLNHPNIQSANGKLGRLGKRVNLQGHSASTGLDEQLTVEVYDDFPSLALLSAQYTPPSTKSH